LGLQIKNNMKHGVVAIISKENEKKEQEYLFVKRTKDYGEFTNMYAPPGGGVEIDETEEQALVREIKEELSWDITNVRKIADTKGDLGDNMLHWYACDVDDGQEMIVQEDELAEVIFVTKEQIEKLNTWPATKKFFEEYIFTDTKIR
jgi:8-oxo-dGTP diphosphatase